MSELWRRADGVWIALAMVAAYALLRTFGAAEPLLSAWTVTAALLALVSPAAGLTLLAALGPVTEALSDDGRITALPFLLAAVGAGTLVRVVAGRRVERPTWPVAAAVVLLVGTAVGVLVSFLRYGQEEGIAAAQLWVPGLGGAMTVMLAAVWLSQRGELRPVFVAVGSVVAGALFSVVDTVTSGGVQHSAFGWLLRGDMYVDRLGGIIPAPNAAAAIFLVGAAICLGAGLLAERREVRLLGWLAVAATVAALGLTYSRSGLLGLAVVAGVFLWRWRGSRGLLAGVVVGGIALVVVGSELLRAVPAVADQQRVEAWAASVRIWLTYPLEGAGFRSFEWLHAQFGSPLLDAPHNEWLRLLAEEGVLVGLAGVVFAVLTPVYALRARGWIGVGAAAAAAGLFLMACFNNPFLYEQVNVPAFIVIGMGLGLAQRAPPEPAQRALPEPAPSGCP